MIARLHRLTQNGSRSWLFAGFVAVVAVASQALVHEYLLHPAPGIADGFAASAAIGLANDRGLPQGRDPSLTGMGFRDGQLRYRQAECSFA